MSLINSFIKQTTKYSNSKEMSQEKSLQLKLMKTQYQQEDQNLQNQQQSTPPVTWNDFQYKQFGNAPKITLSGVVLIILCPLLVSAHIKVANLCQITIVQFLFVTTLVAFIINYLGIIRRYQLMPFLPQAFYDAKLKRICVMAVIAMILSIFIGWNGSGGIIYAMIWQSARGHRIGFVGYMLVVIIAGSLLMEQNYSWKKLFQFIPGIMFGEINSTLFTLQQSSIYPIAHQFLLLLTITVPMLFPVSPIASPSLFQWFIMLVCGVTLLITVLLTIKLMQTERVSVVMGVFCGLMMIGTSSFGQTIDFIGAILILIGIVLMLKKKYIDLQY